MPSSALCTACRQALRQEVGQLRQAQAPYYARAKYPKTINPSRSFTTRHSLSAAQANTKQKEPAPRPHLAVPKTSRIAPQTHQKNEQSSPAAKIPPQSPPKGESATAAFLESPTRSIAKELRKRATNTTETYVAYGVCEKLVKECARQADYTIPQARDKNAEVPKTKDDEDLGVGTGWWYETLGLTPTFATWSQITFLHMYLLNCRLRCFQPAHAPTWQQHLLDHFFYLAEDRMVVIHNIEANFVRQKYLKDMYMQWRGLLAGYDEGLVKGDAVLATAVWRNIFKADEGVDFRGVAEIVSYMRGVLKGLEGLSDGDVASGEVFFGNPGQERDEVLVRSGLMDAPGQLAGGTVEAGGKAKAVK